VALSALIDRRVDDLQTLAAQQERRLAAEAEALRRSRKPWQRCSSSDGCRCSWQWTTSAPATKSLRSLSRLPLDILKIDQSFVARLAQGAEGRAVVFVIVSLATALGVRVTGEGIEAASPLSTLIELDCNHGQGFLLGRPAPPDELAAMLRTLNPTEVTVAARLARLQ
jgi:predicted signal transduction protein with EAL and GGDEF domain